jgi:hypothetical protein
MNKNGEMLYATHTGIVTIGNHQIPCAVLNNGERVFIQREIVGLLTGNKKGGFDRYLKPSNLQPYLPDKFRENSSVQSLFNFKIGSRIAQAFEATDIIDICMMYINAKNEGKLLPNQQHLAAQALVIVSAFAKTGVIAVIDEATGYQYDREKDELQKILKAYIAEELLPWQKRFPDIYYKELFRLNGWEFTVHGIKKRPGVIGKWTNTLVYERLPKGVLEELKLKIPKSETGNKTARYHQFLTLDIGEPNLTAQINRVVTLFQLSDNMQHMWNQFKKLKGRQNGELEIPFKFDDDGHTIETTGL